MDFVVFTTAAQKVCSFFYSHRVILHSRSPLPLSPPEKNKPHENVAVSSILPFPSFPSSFPSSFLFGWSPSAAAIPFLKFKEVNIQGHKGKLLSEFMASKGIKISTATKPVYSNAMKTIGK
jgi:hypothetical protein